MVAPTTHDGVDLFYQLLGEGFYKVALICVFQARLHRATS